MRRHVDAVHGAVGLLGEVHTETSSAAAGQGSPPEVDERSGSETDTEAETKIDAEADTGAAAEIAAGPRSGIRDRWHTVLRTLSARDTIPGIIRGRAVRLLLDDGELVEGEAARLMGLVLSPGTAPGDAAAWIEGFVGGGSGGGMLLVHDERLLGLVDAWLTGVPGDAFTDVLPLLRRTFSAYEPGVRRTLGELVRRGPGMRESATATGSAIPGFAPDLDIERADAVLPVLRLLLGLDENDVAADDAENDNDANDNDLVGVGR